MHAVDGTLIDAWASMKSFRPKDGSGEPPAPGRNGERNFHNDKRSNDSHASTTDPDGRLYRKADGRESRLCFMGHVLMGNRNGFAVGDSAQSRYLLGITHAKNRNSGRRHKFWSALSTSSTPPYPRKTIQLTVTTNPRMRTTGIKTRSRSRSSFLGSDVIAERLADGAARHETQVHPDGKSSADVARGGRRPSRIGRGPSRATCSSRLGGAAAAG